MDRQDEAIIGLIFITIFGFILIFISFIISYLQLNRFKYCYDNGFKFEYCEKYRNY